MASFTFKNNPLNPGTYYITSEFGPRGGKNHDGIDFGTNQRAEPIFAVADGTVSRAEYSSSYGNVVYIDHESGVQTRYAHMVRAPLVKAGQSITAGTQIGNVGTTGDSSGIHLHFELLQNGKAINPKPFLSGSTVYLSGEYVSPTVEDLDPSYYNIVNAGGVTVGQRVSGVTPQPVHAFVNIYLGDNQLLLGTTPARPNIIQSFEYNRLDGAGETATFVVYDDNWEEIEKALSANFNNIYIEYGYYGTGLRSKLVKHLIQNYNIAFESSGTILSFSTVTEPVYQNIKTRNITLNTFNPTEAVKKICKSLGYKVLDKNFDSSSDIEADNPFNMIEEYPISYIQNHIIPQASQINEELFSFDIDADGYAYFKREGYDTSKTDSLRTYIFQKGYDSIVKDFTVDIKGIFGGTGTFQIATEYRASVFTDEETKDISIDKEKATTYATGNITHTDPKQSNSLVDTAGYSPNQVENQLYYRMKSMVNDAYSATLTIVGDPSIQIHEYIRVINVTDEGYLHHTSGVYWVKGITDHIQGGEMTTSLDLVKNATAGDIDGVKIINPKMIIK